MLIIDVISDEAALLNRNTDRPPGVPTHVRCHGNGVVAAVPDVRVNFKLLVYSFVVKSSVRSNITMVNKSKENIIS